MPDHKSYIGEKYGSLKIVQELPPVVYKSGKNRRFLTLCDCGNHHKASVANLIKGDVSHCGCQSSNHGYYGTSLYKRWRSMMNRCYNENSASFRIYGGRGITVCDDWRTPLAFILWAKASGYKESLWLERIDVDGNYEPGNCTWATPREQGNNRRNTRYVRHNGKVVCLKDYAKLAGVKYTTAKYRLNTGKLEEIHYSEAKTRRTPWERN